MVCPLQFERLATIERLQLPHGECFTCFSYNITCGYLRWHRKLLKIQSYDCHFICFFIFLSISLPTLLLNFLTSWSICFAVKFLTLFNIRCSCNRCNNELLVSAREFRCVRRLRTLQFFSRSVPFFEAKQEESANILERVPRMLKMSKRD